MIMISNRLLHSKCRYLSCLVQNEMFLLTPACLHPVTLALRLICHLISLVGAEE